MKPSASDTETCSAFLVFHIQDDDQEVGAIIDRLHADKRTLTVQLLVVAGTHTAFGFL